MHQKVTNLTTTAHVYIVSHTCIVTHHTPSQGGDMRGAPLFVGREVMTGFAGLEESEAPILQAMMDFTYHSALGNMDEAFKSIKFIKR